MDAAATLAELVRSRLAEHPPDRPFLVGIAGAVAVGKSELARSLERALASAAVSVEVVSTDGFLLPNRVLAERGLTARKGFPESYDDARLASFVAALAAGEPEVAAPVYSHQAYDVVAGETRIVRGTDAVILLEGVNALQEPVAGFLDLAVYVDADEDDVIAWYADRFEALRAGDLESHPFYRQFAAVADADVRAVAELVWREVNGANLREHILPSRRRADVIVRKGRDHRVVAVSSQAR